MKENEKQIVVEDVQVLTPHNKALNEAGRSLLVESVGVGREFCKFMTTTTLGAIPTYLALLKFILPKDYVMHGLDKISFLVAPFLFLTSSIIFVIGYFPQRGTMSLDLPDDIERERTTIILRRKRYAGFAFVVFCIGIVFGSWLLIFRLNGLPPPATFPSFRLCLPVLS